MGVLMLLAGMIALVAASFPLYNLFCSITGYGGTTRRVEASELDQSTHALGSWKMRVEFNADTDPSIPWEFKPAQRSVSVKTGENSLAFYTAKNKAEEAVTGMAVYNVTPHQAGKYFHKIQCFCFDRQTLQAGEEVNMPVTFYIDPAIEEDPDLQNIRTITLSYTFFSQ
jgi:cytochrome c oxidase assembly protein subunit 11